MTQSSDLDRENRALRERLSRLSTSATAPPPDGPDATRRRPVILVKQSLQRAHLPAEWPRRARSDTPSKRLMELLVSEPLFSSRDLSQVLSGHGQSLAREVESLDEGRVLGASPADLCTYLVDKYRVHEPQIDEAQVRIDYGDVQIDVRDHPNRLVTDRSRPAYVTGTRITFFVPYTGDRKLFSCRPSRFTFSPPRGAVRDGELVLVYDRTPEDAANIRSEFDGDMTNVKQYLDWVASDVAGFNSALRETANRLVEARREKLLEDRGLVESLGFPLRSRPGVPETYAAPQVKRRIASGPPPAPREPYKPEPALSVDDYEHILSVISNMVMVMERSPQAFTGMGEEDLRQHFLVQLNGHYEGQATGETFNFEGKTDILVRADGKNMFIAECKFWSGPAGLSEALDQLLGYAAWRDTKTALLLFNRDRNMSTVLNAIPDTIRADPRYKGDRAYESETGFRYVFGHRDDPTRDLTLTVLVFDVPG